MNIIRIIPGLILAVAMTATAAPKATPPGLLHDRNSPVGLRALESFSGPDRVGKDGPMVKVGFDLGMLYHEHRDFKQRGGARVLKRKFQSSRKLVRVRNEKVVIDAVAQGDVDQLVSELEALGMEDTAVFGRVVSGQLPIGALERASQLSALKLVRPAYAMTMAGLVTSQGDAAQLSDDARSTFSVDGSGVTVGTLSDSYDCKIGAAADVSSNDLPSGVLVLAEEPGCGISGTDEGRAMMQIVHDVAPGASQAFHTAFGGTADFANGIIELAMVAGSDIINDDVIYFAEPMFQDGVIAQAVDAVKAMGVAYFSSAGNQDDQSYEDGYRDSGVSGYFSGSTRHDFDPGPAIDTLMEVSIPGNTQVIFSFQWDQPAYSVSGAPGSASDIDIVLYSESGQQALAAGSANNIGGDPVEVFAYTTSSGPTKKYQIGIEHYSGSYPGRVKFVYFGNMTINQFKTRSSTSYGHANAAGAQAVGAARYSHTPDFGVSPPLREYFSSKGGTEILFDTSGNPVNILRQKPEIIAPDGGDNTFFGSDYEGNGFPNFFGTSAAAPHAAGVAALLKQYDNSLDADGVYAAMQDTAIDMDAAGVDFFTGHGLVQATAALQSLDPDSDVDGIPNASDNCPNFFNPGQHDNDSDGLGDVCDPDDDNDGLTDLLEISLGSNPVLADTDGDGLSDGDEVNVHGTDPLSTDTDGDGLSDGDEVKVHGTDPLSTDTDSDGMPDGWEIANGLAPLVDDSTADPDLDGLNNLAEFNNNTDPNFIDTDGDTLQDGDELNIYMTNPALADTDGDGFDDNFEIDTGSDPNSNTSIPDVIANGDINADGKVDTADVVLATRIVLGDLIPTTNQLIGGDAAPVVGGVPVPDGTINTGDLVVILRRALGSR